MAKQFKVGELVVFNHELDAAVFRVMDVAGHKLGVGDKTIEDMGHRPCVQWIDKSLAKPLSVGQLAQIK